MRRIYCCGAQLIKVLPMPPVTGQSIVHADALVCVHIPVELMEKERKGIDESEECRDKTAMKNEREA